MNIGSSVAIFLVLSIILLVLFCLLTKYFHHKLNQNLQEAVEIYSMVDEMGANQCQSQNNDGNYEKYKEMEMDKILKAESKKKPGYEEIQMAQMTLKTPLKNKDDDLYGANILKMRLNNEIIPRIMETGRSMSSLKQFKPTRLMPTNRTGRSNNGGNDTGRSMDRTGKNLNNDENTSYHTFVNKLVCYDSQGITVVQVEAMSIRKVGEGAFKENKTVKAWTTLTEQKNFDDQLQIFGFERGDFACYKYLTKVEVNNMKVNEDYALKTLKTCEVKQSMEVEEYLRVKIDLQSIF